MSMRSQILVLAASVLAFSPLAKAQSATDADTHINTPTEGQVFNAGDSIFVSGVITANGTISEVTFDASWINNPALANVSRDTSPGASLYQYDFNTNDSANPGQSKLEAPLVVGSGRDAYTIEVKPYQADLSVELPSKTVTIYVNRMPMAPSRNRTLMVQEGSQVDMHRASRVAHPEWVWTLADTQFGRHELDHAHSERVTRPAIMRQASLWYSSIDHVRLPVGSRWR